MVTNDRALCQVAELSIEDWTKGMEFDETR